MKSLLLISLLMGTFSNAGDLKGLKNDFFVDISKLDDDAIAARITQQHIRDKIELVLRRNGLVVREKFKGNEILVYVSITDKQISTDNGNKCFIVALVITVEEFAKTTQRKVSKLVSGVSWRKQAVMYFFEGRERVFYDDGIEHMAEAFANAYLKDNPKN